MTDTLQRDLAQILDNVSRRHKVSRAAIVDFHGNVIAATSSWIIPSDDPKRLHNVLLASSACRNMWRMAVFGEDFHCLRCVDAQTMLGYSKTTVMTAHVTRMFVVVGLAPVQTPGSCLHEMNRAWVDIESQGF